MEEKVMTYEEACSQYDMAVSIIASSERELKELHRKYGTGVRPSWVSAEEADYGMRIQRWNEEAERCKQIKLEQGNAV